ncbi:MAG: glycosyltransferase family 2 protein [Aeromicrobium sp.]|nr:glycosyltransferase family 2 protein [Burkholderiales bacterium]
MHNPLISILIPSYNAGQWIAETLEASLAQTWRHTEIIVVDDGSTDETIEVVKTFESRGVKLIVQQNRGASAARNAAFRASAGEFIQFLDADDIISPDKIRCQLRRLLQQQNAVAICPWGRFYDNPAHVRLDPSASWQDLPPVDWLVATWSLGGGMLFPAMWLVPRRVINRAGLWREDLSLNDDGEFFTRVVLASDHVLFCQEGTAYYRSGIPGSLSGTRSERGFKSGFEAIRASIENTRAVEDSNRVRRCGALLWQVYAHGAYPHCRELASDALRNARVLHDVKLSPVGGLAFCALSNVLGWKVARRLQEWLRKPS